MSILQCAKCKKEFDDKYYINNDLGFRENLLLHIKKHKEDSDIEFWYFKLPQSTRSKTKRK